MQDQGLEMQSHRAQWKHRQSRFDRNGGEIGAENTQAPESIQGDMAAERTPGTSYETMLAEFLNG
jgi:hypothetical protein